MPVSTERIQAISTYPADLQTVGSHLSGSVTPSLWLDKPDNATHIKLQAITKGLRYRIDGGVATATVGFQLSGGSESLIPVSNNGISLAEEDSTTTYQAQQVR